MQLTLQQRVLAHGILAKKGDATIDYKLEGGAKAIRGALRPGQESQLIRAFSEDPKGALALVRQNMFSIMRDSRMVAEGKQSRLERYLNHYFGLMLFLDHEAFPRDPETVHSGIPLYIPDGFSDMGKECAIDSDERIYREKIGIDKARIFEQARQFLLSVYRGSDHKEDMVRLVAGWVHDNLPYDYANSICERGNGSIGLDEVAVQGLSACRHHALYAQVLNQAIGLTSRLTKSKMNGLGHAMNVVRINNIWHLLDVTNPLVADGKDQVCLVALSDSHIDLNDEQHSWRVCDDRGEREYRTHSRMFYRVR